MVGIDATRWKAATMAAPSVLKSLARLIHTISKELEPPGEVFWPTLERLLEVQAQLLKKMGEPDLSRLALRISSLVGVSTKEVSPAVLRTRQRLILTLCKELIVREFSKSSFWSTLAALLDHEAILLRKFGESDSSRLMQRIVSDLNDRAEVTSDSFRDLRPIPGENLYVDLDDGRWGVFGDQSGFLYSVYDSREEAEASLASKTASMGLADPWMSQEDVRAVCPPCADRMASLNIRDIRASAFFGQDVLKLASQVEAKKWQSLPKGWTQDSLEKFWNSMTGDAKHRVTKCMKKMEGKVDDPGAFCAAARDRIEGTKWRGEER